ncbi:MAG: S8 family serine peptidase [Desulfobacterales bacterium]|nr:S8 family serine peptidase [Desulfobacterales bacterium]MBF0396341.1 S8 family serine peptidase [Desulfobacterales bacterium]
MQKIINCLCLILILSYSSVLNGEEENQIQKAENYVPSEILVKFKPSLREAALERYRLNWNMQTLELLKSIGVDHIKLPYGMTVTQALSIIKSDSDVIYAEPNYYWHIQNTPNDSDFNKLWGLQNTGQNVNGTSGLQGADIHAVDAWDIDTGNSKVIIAVLDSGVDYYHPDISDNIWKNEGECLRDDNGDCKKDSNNSIILQENGKDDDKRCRCEEKDADGNCKKDENNKERIVCEGNGYIDDIYGWDLWDNDNSPVDPKGHGTHIAGILAAVGNNSKGVAGVNWKAKIMSVKCLNALGTTTTDVAVKAIEYATNMEAHIINCSWGGYEDSSSLKDAISKSSALFVCAAGNDSNDNDAKPAYPASYDLPNVISVAATDQNDNLASFSNYGVKNVKVAAPGVNIYSSFPGDQTLWSDNFDDGNFSTNWTHGGTNDKWGITSSTYYSSPNSLAVDSSGGSGGTTDSWAKAPTRDLSSKKGCKLQFKIKGTSEKNWDILYVQTSTDGSSWTNMDISVDKVIYPADTGISGEIKTWGNATVDLGKYDGKSTVYIRLRFKANGYSAGQNWYIDDMTIKGVKLSSSDYTDPQSQYYQYFEGTSVSAPYVSGLAGLIKSIHPSWAASKIKTVIQNTVDKLSSLNGKVETGGRISAYSALIFIDAPTNLSASSVSSSQIDLNWTDNSDNEEGYKIERKTGADGTYVELTKISSNTVSYNDTGLNQSTNYYYRVSAYSSKGSSGYSNEANATTSKPQEATTTVAPSGEGNKTCFIETLLSF